MPSRTRPTAPRSEVDVTVNKATPAWSNLSSPSIVYGTPSTTISGSILGGATLPTGDISITLDGTTQQAAIGGVPGTPGLGSFSSTFNTQGLAVASSPYTIAYSYAGDAKDLPATATSLLAVAAATPSWSNLTGSSIVYGTASATLSGTILDGTTPPTGSVSITLDGTTQQAAIGGVSGTPGLGNFSASFDTHALPVAGSPYPITYTYAGDANSNAAPTDTSQTLTVVDATPSWSNLSAPSITYGTGSTTLSGTILDGTTPPTGSVSITLDGTTQQAAIGADGSFSATFDTQGLAVASSPYPITYAYAGDANSNPAPSDTTQTLTVADATPSWSNLSAPSITYGTGSTTLSGTILDGTTPPTGSVAITLGGTTQQAAIGADGSFSASFDTQGLAVASSPYPITYTYAGDANSNAAPTDTSQTLTVAKATPSWSNLSAPSITYGTGSTTLSGTILDGTTPPTGNVSITLGGTTQQAAIGADGSFSATFDTQGLAVASSPYPIAYTYAGDANSNAAPTDTSQTLTVAKATPSWSNLSAPSITYGTGSTTLSGTILDGTTPPTGNVSITLGGTTQQAAIGADGSFSASFDTQGLAVAGSPYPITYTYAGDANSNAAPTDTSQTLTVAKATPSWSNLSAPSITYGTGSTTLSGTILDGTTPPTGYPPAGDVSITLGGTTQQAAIGADGSFSSVFDTQGLAITGSPYTITYSYAGDVNSNAAPTDTTQTLTVAKATPSWSNLSAPSITYGTDSTTLSGTILDGTTPPTGYPPAGNVAITLGGATQQAAIGADGSFSSTFNTQGLAVASSPYAITYTYAGDANSNPAPSDTTQTLTVAKANPAWSNLSAPSIAYGTASTTLSGTILDGATAPTGSVAITLGGATQQAAIGADGTFSSTFNTQGLAVASSPYPITYTYAGDANSNPAPTDSSQTLTVAKATPSWSNLSAPSIAYGTASTTLSGTILDGATAPTGSVAITLGGTTQQAAIGADGSFSATFDTQGLTVAGSPYPITYTYAGDANSNAAPTDTSQTLTVAKATPSWSNLSAPSITYGTGSTTLSGTILDGTTPPTGYPPAGNVSITLGGTTQQAAIGADGSFSSVFDTQGLAIAGSPYTITYSYAGDVNSNPAAANTSQTVTVAKATPSWSNLSAPSIAYGTASTTLSGTILDGATAPTGSVSITLGGTTQEAAIGPDGSFSSTFNTQGLAVASSPYPITYAYAGDANSNPAPSDTTQTLTVAKATPSWSNLSAPSITYGTASTTLSGTILDGATAPTGSVSITLGGTTQVAAIGPDGSFSATFNTQGLPVASSPYAITYTYAGDANSNAAPSDTTQTLTVAKATPAWSNLSAPSIAPGTASVTLSGTILDGKTAPTGSVSITLGGTTQQATIGPDGSFSSTFNTQGLAVASSPYAITYTYAGDANSNAAPSDTSQSLTVAKATPSWSNLSAPSITYGTASTTLAGTILNGQSGPAGNVSITLDGTTQQAAIGADGGFSSTFDTQALAVAGSPYTITTVTPAATLFLPRAPPRRSRSPRRRPVGAASPPRRSPPARPP